MLEGRIARTPFCAVQQVAPEPLAGIGDPGGCFGVLLAGREALGEQGVEQRRQIREAAIDGGDPDAGRVRDLVERDAGSAFRQQAVRCLKDELAVALCVRPKVGVAVSGHAETFCATGVPCTSLTSRRAPVTSPHSSQE